MHRRVLLILLLVAPSVWASEAGLPPITMFRQEQHKGGVQTFGLTRDSRGRLYFANSEGLLIYDGAWWSRVSVPGYTAWDAAVDAHDRVGVGVLDGFGVLAPDANGALAYRDLVPLLPAELRKDIGQAATCTSAGKLVFVAPHFAAMWDGARLQVVERSTEANRGRRCMDVGGNLFLATFNGLVEARSGRRTFAGKRVDYAVPQFVIIRNEGLFRYDETPVDTDASQWLKNKGVMHAKVLRDGRIAIATLRFGLLITTPDGRIDQIIDSAAGLPAVFLYEVEQDLEGSLWLGMDNSIVRVAMAATVTQFDSRVGLRGGPQAIGRHDGKLLVGTPDGLFAIEPGNRTATAKRILDLGTNYPWSLLSTADELLIGAYGGVFVVRRNAAPQLIDGMADLTVYAMVQSSRDPNRVWLGADKGLGILQRDGGTWRFAGMAPHGPEHVRQMIDGPDGSLWCGTETEGAMRIDADGTATRFGIGQTSVVRIGDRVTIVSSEGFFAPAANGTLVPDPLLGKLPPAKTMVLAANDAAGNIWLSMRPPRVVRRQRDGSYAQDALAIGAIEGDAQAFYADSDGVMWIGTDRGVYRVGSGILTPAHAQPSPAIRRVVDGNEHLIALTDPSLPYKFGRVRIEVSPLSYASRTEYQYRLDPADSEWGPWTEQAFLDYTNLAPNDYTFRVRTRGMAGSVSKEARWSFSVLAPWYATGGAVLFWILIALLTVAAIVAIRTGALRHRARLLQQLVDEQTVMLRQANERLERLSLIDDLTGAANRRAFDRALGEQWKRAVRHDVPLSIVMLDLDHFKAINDTQGHAAGDEYLRKVARLLQQAIRDDGDDIVARWGGEEFVLLLGNADEPAALAVAERIRASIESLGVTASLGVATRSHEGDPDSLIRRADLALYSAKRAGRNCVRAVERKSA